MVDIKQVLEFFPEARVHSSYIRICCPYHKDGKEKRPSMGIVIQDKPTAPAGLCHCFACGKKIMWQDMIKELFNKTPLDPAIQSETALKIPSLITNQLYHKTQLPYRFSAYLESRGISKETQKRFKTYEDNGKVYMPVFSREGIYLYVNARSTTSKHYFIQGGIEKTLWGIEEVDLAKPIVICEGQIDGMTLWEAGIQAVATLGADNYSSLEQVKNATSNFLIAFDNDSAGIRHLPQVIELLGKYRCRVLRLPPNIDVNGLYLSVGKSNQDFISYIKENAEKLS